MNQIASGPPTFVFFVNDEALFPETYKRFLERKLRENLNLRFTPIKMIWRGKSLRQVTRAMKRGELGKSLQGIVRR